MAEKHAKIDLTNQINWNKNAIPNIADELGFVLNKHFIRAVETFMRTTTRHPISVPILLPVVATKFFNEYHTPPLKKASPKSFVIYQRGGNT